MADKLARMIAGLPPEQEHQFQTFMAFDPNVRAWKNGFQNKYGEMPNTESDPTFNYREAWAAGNKPQAYGFDTMPHWDSRGKAPDHSTAWMQTFFDQNNGLDPNVAAQTGFTPPQSQMVNGQLAQDLLTQLLRRNAE